MSVIKTTSTTKSTSSGKASTWLATASSLAVMFMVMALVVAQMTPPATKPATSQTAFSTERALEHLQVIASVPHPTGTMENMRVGQYLFDQLTSLGLQPEFQEATSVYVDEGKWGVAGPRGLEADENTWSLAGANIRNIIARIPGSDSTGAVLLMAHYDSVPYGPGASDDGAGTAAILETARALLSGAQLRNDVILLLMDGEEIGLMGSQAFAKHHPWMGDAAVVFNLEARGSSGIPIMYETSIDNAWLIREYARATQNQVTGSVASDVYRLLPNSSDLTIFLEAGVQGLNFAYTENWTDYHTTHDSIEDLDERSLQQHGNNALALARHFGEIDLKVQSNSDSVFFSVLRLGVVHYPKSWALPLSLMAIVVFGLVSLVGFRSGIISLSGLGLGLLAVFLSATTAALIGYITVQGLDLLKNGELQVGMGGTYNNHSYEIGLLAIYLPVSAAIYLWFKKRSNSANLVAGALLYWLVLTIGSSFFLPGGSYLFLWPLMAGLAALYFELVNSQPGSTFKNALRLLPVTVGLLLAGTALYLITVMFGVMGYPATGAFTILILGLLFPYLDFSSLPRPSLWFATSALIGILAIGTGMAKGYSSEQPRQNTFFYSMNADIRTAAWVAKTTPPDTSLSPWLDGATHADTWDEYFPAAWSDDIWVNMAPSLEQSPPEMIVIADTVSDGIRTLSLHLDSPRGAWAIMANVIADGAILEAEINGETSTQESPRDHVFFKMIGLASDGINITVKLQPGVPVNVRIADVTPSLPEIDGLPVQLSTPLRTGYGGGHGVDSMTLIHREYTVSP